MDATTFPSIPPSLSSPSDSPSPPPAPPNHQLHSTKKNKLGLTIMTTPSRSQPQALNMDAYYNVIISQQLKTEAKALDTREDALVAREIELEKKEAAVERYTASSGKELARTQRQLARVQREIAELQELERSAAVLEQGGGSGDREGVVEQGEGDESSENKGATREALPLSTIRLYDSAIAMLKRERELDSHYQKPIDTSLVERLFSTFSLPADADRAFGVSGLSADEKHADTQKPDLLAETDKDSPTQVQHLQTADYSRNQCVDGTVDGSSNGRQQRNDGLASYTMDMHRGYTKASAVPRPVNTVPTPLKRAPVHEPKRLEDVNADWKRDAVKAHPDARPEESKKRATTKATVTLPAVVSPSLSQQESVDAAAARVKPSSDNAQVQPSAQLQTAAINAPPKDKRSENLKATLRKLAELYPEKKVTRSKPMSNSLNPLVVAAREMGARAPLPVAKKTSFAPAAEEKGSDFAHTVANLKTKASESDVQAQTPEHPKASLTANDISSEVSPLSLPGAYPSDAAKPTTSPPAAKTTASSALDEVSAEYAGSLGIRLGSVMETLRADWRMLMQDSVEAGSEVDEDGADEEDEKEEEDEEDKEE